MSVRVTHNSGFFSCCSMRLWGIVLFINENGCLPNHVDSSEQFQWYKVGKTGDLTYDYFKHYDSVNSCLSTVPIDYHQDYQFKEYATLDFDAVIPVVKKYFSPSADILQRIASIETRYAIECANTCVLFYRGNNKSIETLLSGYDEYIAYAKELAGREPGIRFLVQSDETEFIETMLANVPNSFYLKDDVRHMPKCHTSVDLVMRSGNYAFSKNYLAVTYLMSKCKYVVCGSGNCSIWIVLFRGNANNVYQNLNGQWFKHDAIS